MARSAILHEDSTVMHCHMHFQLFCQQFNITRAVHICSRWQKGDPSHNMFRNRNPNHLTWWMLHRRNRVFLIESNVSFPNYEYCSVESPENMTLPHCAGVQFWWFLAKVYRLAFIAGVRRGFPTGLLDFKPNSRERRRETVMRPTVTPLSSKAARTLLIELSGDLVTILFMRWSSLIVVFLGLPVLCKSL